MLSAQSDDAQQLSGTEEKVPVDAARTGSNPKKIIVSLQPPEITYENKVYQVEPDGAIFINALVEKDGEWVAGETLEMRADRVKRKLPSEIEKLVESARGKGHRIRRSTLE